MEGTGNKNYDVIIVGAGPGGIFSAYELMKKSPELKLAVFESGYPLLYKAQFSLLDKEGKVLHQVSDLCDHERLWRCRRIF